MLLRLNFWTFVQEMKSEIENRKLKIEDSGKVHDLRFSNSVFRCGFATLGSKSDLGYVRCSTICTSSLVFLPSQQSLKVEPLLAQEMDHK